jgi:ribose transport system permease protein
VLRRARTPGTAWILGFLVVLLAAFSTAAPGSFATGYNLTQLGFDASVLLVLGVGMTFVVVTAGIDLSVGSVLVFSGVMASTAMRWAGGGYTSGWGVVALGFAAALGSGLAWGVVNGLLVAKARITPLIATLGTLGMALGLAEIVTGGVDPKEVPAAMSDTVGNGAVVGSAAGGLPWLVVVALAVCGAAGLVLSRTRFGLHTYAIGSNAEAARRVGIDVDRHLVEVYALSGLTAGLAGFLTLAKFSTMSLTGHTADNLAAIAAVVLGGTSLFGGVGTVFGTLVGTLIPAVLQRGFVIIGFQPFWQQVAVGAVLVLAVYVDQLRRRSRERP